MRAHWAPPCPVLALGELESGASLVRQVSLATRDLRGRRIECAHMDPEIGAAIQAVLASSPSVASLRCVVTRSVSLTDRGQGQRDSCRLPLQLFPHAPRDGTEHS